MRRIINSNAGFSLIEILIVMLLFVVVMMITSSALNTVLSKGTIVQRSEESNIEGVIGLEMFRHDLAQAGLGLFSDIDDPPIYAEAVGTAAAYNDSNRTPRAIVTGNNSTLANNVVLNGTDYLAIKATTVGNNPIAQRWTYVTDGGDPHPRGTNDLEVGNIVIALSQTYNAKRGVLEHTLVKNSPTDYEIAYANPSIPAYTPSTGRRYYFYGIQGAANLRAPFNRTDYYVRRPDAGVPTSCSPGTGMLYKAVMSHALGTLTPEIPILDCVADMQIVLGWNSQVNPEGSNAVDVLSSADGNANVATNGGAGLNGLDIPAILADPIEVRKRLRQIKVYILAQDGAMDPNPNFVNANISFPIADPGEGVLIQRPASPTWVPGAADGTVNLTATPTILRPNMSNYRWKVYRIVVKPKNLG